MELGVLIGWGSEAQMGKPRPLAIATVFLTLLALTPAVAAPAPKTPLAVTFYYLPG